MKTLALDVYGTLINPHAIAIRLSNSLGERASDFSQLWRTKQLEFSFRRGLMNDYADFSIVTQEALDYVDSTLDARLNRKTKEALLTDYTRLQPYSDVVDALSALRADGRVLFAFSNGLPSDLESLMEHAGIAKLLDGIVSVHEVRSFKPDPKVYAHFEKTTKTKKSEIALVSGNGFDLTGACACGWSTVWLKRDDMSVFDGWGCVPDQTISTLDELVVSTNEL